MCTIGEIRDFVFSMLQIVPTATFRKMSSTILFKSSDKFPRGENEAVVALCIPKKAQTFFTKSELMFPALSEAIIIGGPTLAQCDSG